MYFKDVITEIRAMLMQIIKKKEDPMLCPHCGKASLKKCPELVHMIEVAVRKFIGSSGAGSVSGGAASPLGGAVPAPDYWFQCPKCHKIYIMQEDIITGGGKFVDVNIFDRVFSFGQGNQKKKNKEKK